jgi:hypothetical protein
MQRSLSTATSQAAVQPEATKPKQQHTRNKAKVPYKGGQNKKKAPRRPLHDPNDALYTKCSIRVCDHVFATPHVCVTALG